VEAGDLVLRKLGVPIDVSPVAHFATPFRAADWTAVRIRG
jgi:hypothetical protein